MIGTDIIEVSRIEKLIKEKGDKFLNKIYRWQEIEYCESKGLNKYQHYAGKFAAKEAIFKAIDVSCRFGQEYKLRLKDIQINNWRTLMDDDALPEGAPYVTFWDDEGLMDDYISHYYAKVSISHTKEYAVAFAMLVEK